MTFMAEAFFSGCISKVINDGKDYSWTKIKKVINDKNDRNLSTKIYRVIENTLNKVTDKKFKDTDKLYGAIERIFIEFRNNGSTIESVKCGLILLCSDVSDQRCENFLEKFYDGVCQDEDLFKRISLILQEKGIKINQEEFQQLNEKVDNLTDIVSSRNDRKIYLPKKVPVKSRTQEYADKWNANMFLNDFDKRDKNAGVNVKLSEVYLEEHLPHYIWGDSCEPFHDLKVFLAERIYEDNYYNQMLLILGQPGIGKSTLITWVIAKFISKIDTIFVYQFASDLKKVRWENIGSSDNILSDIFKVLDLSHEKLDGKTIILDGFDEISIKNDRAEILNQLNWELKKEYSLTNFSLLILCRENYIQRLDKVECDYITLQSWGDKQIRSFCNVFYEKTKNIISEITINKMVEKKEIFGIPLILYMVLALDISIDKEGSIVDVYDKIFSLEDGGIYDRCFQSKRYEVPHRISDIKNQIHQISREIAIWMFENNPDEASIPQEEYQKICNHIMKDYTYEKEDFKIGNFFKSVKHCEGIETEELSFVHRSIYEYFVAETIYDSIEKSIMDLTGKSQEDFAKNIAFYLKEGKISTTIGEYLQHKIIKLYKKMDDEKKQRFYPWWESAVDKMMDTGMFYYTNRNIHDYKYIMDKESNCFINLMEILRLLLVTTDRKYIMESVHTSRLVDYIKLNRRWYSLNKVYLKDADLRGAKLHEFDLHEAYLYNADLERADLTAVNLQNTDLQEADLRGALFRPMDLGKAILKGTKFDERQIVELEKCEFDLREVQVFIEKKNCFIRYEEYYKMGKRKQIHPLRG